MYLIDTNVISELRKQRKAHPGVLQFFQQATEENSRVYISVITIGELRRGVEVIRGRGDRD
jgi:toxin FitB